MINQFDDIFDILGSDIVIIIVVSLVFSLILFATQILIGGVTFKWGLEAVDGRDEGYGSRVGTVFVVILINSFLPFIGLFLGWKFIASRHDLNYGESILAYIVYNLPLAIITALISIIISGIVIGIIFLTMMI